MESALAIRTRIRRGAVGFRYGLGPDAAPPGGGGALSGRQLSALPCRAWHVPVTLPRGALKLQAWPLVKDWHAASASGGGVRWPLPPGA
jgi:hypothetical protein